MSTYLSRKNATPISILYNPLILDNFPHNVKYKTIGRNWVIKHSTRRDFLKCKDDKEMEKSFFIMNTSKKGQMETQRCSPHAGEHGDARTQRCGAPQAHRQLLQTKGADRCPFVPSLFLNLNYLLPLYSEIRMRLLEPGRISQVT